MAETARRTLGSVRLLEVNADPDGGITAPKGSVAFDSANGDAYQNTDGATAWDALGGGGAAAGDGGGYILSYGADISTLGFHPAANGEASATQIATATVASELVAPEDGTITALGWTSTAADATTDVKIVVNGTPGSVIDLTGATGVVTGLAIAVSAGDRIAIEVDAGATPRTSTWTAFLGTGGAKIHQIVSTTDTAVTTTATTIPNDNTTPTISEGAQWTTLSITTKEAGSLLHLTANLYVSNTTNVVMTMAVFDDANVCIGTAAETCDSNASPGMLTVDIPAFAHGAAGVQVYKVRVGPTGGTMTLNGIGGVGRYNGTLASTIIATEYEN